MPLVAYSVRMLFIAGLPGTVGDRLRHALSWMGASIFRTRPDLAQTTTQ